VLVSSILTTHFEVFCRGFLKKFLPLQRFGFKHRVAIVTKFIYWTTRTYNRIAGPALSGFFIAKPEALFVINDSQQTVQFR